GAKLHPEGGHYREPFRGPRQVEGRPASTAILFLLASGERSPGTGSTRSKSGTITRARRSSSKWSMVPRKRSSAWARPCGRGPASDGAGTRLASRREPRSLDIDRLHRRTRFLIRRIRNGAWGLVAAQPNAAIGLVRATCGRYCACTPHSPREHGSCGF